MVECAVRVLAKKRWERLIRYSADGAVPVEDLRESFWVMSLRPEGTSGRHALFLLAAVNILNLADAILTDLAIRAGLATELNPVASAIGTPGKVALVGVASFLLYRIRPRALVWPALVLASVVGYIGIAFLTLGS